MIQVIKLKKDRSVENEHKMNSRLATLVNIVYALAMCIESIAIDRNEHPVLECAIKLRSKVHEANKSISQDFGDWAEYVESLIYEELSEHIDISLHVLCFLIHKYSKKMECCYQQYDPNFEFYQKEEIKVLKQYADNSQLPAFLIKRVDVVIKKCMVA